MAAERQFFLAIEDFPSQVAGQNGGHSHYARAAERRRNRAMGKLMAVDAINRLRSFEPLDGRLRMDVYAESPLQDHVVHDTLNLPAMLKGYFDGFTDAGVWHDDKQVVHLVVIQRSGEEIRTRYPLGCLTFYITGVRDEEDI